MAEIYDNDTRTAIKRFTTLFEPLVILVMGVVVGALILVCCWLSPASMKWLFSDEQRKTT